MVLLTPIALRSGAGDIQSKNSTPGNLEINICYTCYKGQKMQALLEQVDQEINTSNPKPRKAEVNSA